MKRKSKISYLLMVPGLWWHHEKKKWCLIDYGVSSSKRFKTANSCFKQANILINKGYKPFVTRLFWKKGEARSMEWGKFVKWEIFDGSLMITWDFETTPIFKDSPKNSVPATLTSRIVKKNE